MSKIDDWLKQAESKLIGVNVMTARLDCLVLLEDLLGKDRAHLLAHPELELTSEQEKVLNDRVARRAKHEPLAYIRQKIEFYGEEFYVDERVLVPRPETETMIGMLKGIGARGQGSGMTLVDVGTGSGAIAISAKKALPLATVYAIDISAECLAVAKQNASNHGADIHLLQGNLLNPYPLTTKPYTLLCNLPYVPDTHTINQAAKHEPRLAIFGGPDGLDLYRELFTQISQHKTKPSQVLTESLPPQHEALSAIAAEHGYRLTKTDDFIQLFCSAS